MNKVTRNNNLKNKSASNKTALVEKLEDRQLMSGSVQLVDGMLIVQGALHSHSRLTVTPDANGTTLFARANKAKGHYLIKDVQSIRIVGSDRPDEIGIDATIKKPSFIRGGAGADTVTGGGGSDSIFGGSGNDSLTGGAGDDLVLGQGGSNKISAGNGDDPTKISPTHNSANQTSVTRFALIDATTNEVIATLGDTSVLNLAKLPKRLNVSAMVSTGGEEGSIAFVYDGQETRVENHAPFALAADTNGDFNGWTPRAGTHTLAATPYAGKDANGAAGTALNVTFTVIDDADSPALTGGATPAETDDTANNNADNTTDQNDQNAPTAAIELLDASVPAGNSIHANALKSTLKIGDVLGAKYEWTFGDDGSKYNTLTGFNVAHAYTKAGTYQITLRVTNSAGKVDTTASTVTITDANRRFIYVSPDGNDSNNGSTQGNAVKTFGRAADLVDDNTEVLFERGGTYTTKTAMDLGHSNVTVGAYGTGSKPVLKYTGGMNFGAILTTMGGKDVLVHDVAFDSTSTSTKDQGYNDGVRIGGQDITVRDCTFINVGYAINTNGFPDGVLVQDNTAPNKGSVRAYFAWVQGADHVYLGNSAKDSVDQHNLRVGGADRVNIQYNDFANPAETGGLRGTLTIHKGSYVWVANNKLTTGSLGLGPLDAGAGLDDKGARLEWVVVEQNDIDAIVKVSHGTDHVSVRNNVIEADDNIAIDMPGWSNQYNRGTSDVYIVHNTVINNGTTGKFLKVSGPVTGVTVSNNLYVAPKLTTGASNTAPMDILNRDLTGFRLISDNIWPAPTILDAADGGINYVGNSGDASGYKTPAEWEAYNVVQHDQFQDVTLNDSYLFTIGGTTAGANMKLAA